MKATSLLKSSSFLVLGFFGPRSSFFFSVSKRIYELDSVIWFEMGFVVFSLFPDLRWVHKKEVRVCCVGTGLCKGKGGCRVTDAHRFSGSLRCFGLNFVIRAALRWEENDLGTPLIYGVLSQENGGISLTQRPHARWLYFVSFFTFISNLFNFSYK